MSSSQTFRIGGRVVTQDCYFARVEGIEMLSDGALLLTLNVAGIGLRENVAADMVRPSDCCTPIPAPRRRRPTIETDYARRPR